MSLIRVAFASQGWTEPQGLKGSVVCGLKVYEFRDKGAWEEKEARGGGGMLIGFSRRKSSKVSVR